AAASAVLVRSRRAKSVGGDAPFRWRLCSTTLAVRAFRPAIECVTRPRHRGKGSYFRRLPRGHLRQLMLGLTSGAWMTYPTVLSLVDLRTALRRIDMEH